MLYVDQIGAVAQLARAPALQAGGRGFESHQLHERIPGQRGCLRRNNFVKRFLKPSGD